MPTSVQPIKNKTVSEGGNLSLSCLAAGTPPPMVSWVRVSSGQRIYSNELVITNISRIEAGEYRCEASNECGNASGRATIDVQCKLINICINYL